MSVPTTTAAVVRTLPGPGAYMCGLTWDGTHLWHSDQDAATIVAVDPADGRVVRQHACGWVRADLTHDGTQLYQVGGRPKRLVVVDPDDGHIVEHREVPPHSGRLTGLEMVPEGLWMCLRGPTVVQLRDVATMAVRRELPALGTSPSGLTWADGLVVYGDFDDAVLRAMDPATGAQVGAVAVVGRPTGVTWDGALLWYCDFPARSFRALELSEVTGGRAS